MRRGNEDRVYGPYKHGNKWRVVVRSADGREAVESFTELATAEATVDAARSQAKGRTVRQAVETYLAYKRERGCKASTIARDEYHLERFLGLPANDKRKVTWLRNRGGELYEAARVGIAVDNHRNGLKVARAFGRYAVKQSWLTRSPFEDVEGIGRRKSGKPQIRIDEARTLYDFCLARAAADPARASEPIGVLAVLLLGPRATEVVDREVRDLDDHGRVLWIPDSKTAAGRRHLEVPDDLRPLLVGLAKGKIGKAALFTDREGNRPTRYWMHYWCKRMCELAGVPIIPPHGLRGTHSSIAKRGGATGAIVSAQLGHAVAVPEVTDRSYVRRDATQAATTAAVVSLLGARRERP